MHGAFVWRTTRGAAAGGVRLWQYDNFMSYIRDGIRLALGMGRKNALAGIWWGGGKGVIARPKDGNPDTRWRRRDFRDILFLEYGCLMSSIRGCYVTAEDLGVRVCKLFMRFFNKILDSRLRQGIRTHSFYYLHQR